VEPTLNVERRHHIRKWLLSDHRTVLLEAVSEARLLREHLAAERAGLSLKKQELSAMRQDARDAVARARLALSRQKGDGT
jgi:hypothetical protein